MKNYTMEVQDNSKEKDKVAGMITGGCLLLGMGVGFFIGKLLAGLFIGLGIGVLAGAAYRVRN